MQTFDEIKQNSQVIYPHSLLLLEYNENVKNSFSCYNTQAMKTEDVM